MNHDNWIAKMMAMIINVTIRHIMIIIFFWK